VRGFTARLKACSTLDLEMLIRPATAADLPAIRALEQAAETAAHWSARDYDSLFAPDAPKRLALVAEEHGRLCAFIIANCATNDWEIENVVVAPTFRHQGIATQLIRQIVQRAQAVHATSVLLEVRESNLAARQLYTKAGFTEAGRRPGYYRNPAEDALILKISMPNL
jgi:[ribosomal protein S18]-alanine N-acetyltransferase